MPIFRIKTVKIYTGKKKIYTGIPVAPVTNMRYASLVRPVCLVSIFKVRQPVHRGRTWKTWTYGQDDMGNGQRKGNGEGG